MLLTVLSLFILAQFVYCEDLVVGVKKFVPFVQFDKDPPDSDNGTLTEKPTGFSIELMDLIASVADFTPIYKIVDEDGNSLTNLLQATQDGELDMAIAGITITKEREVLMDFSHSMYVSGIGIVVNGVESSGFFEAIISPTIWIAICTILLLTYFFAICVWICERRNPAFQAELDTDVLDSDEYAYIILEGLWQSLWWGVVTVTTIGYGDKVPETKLGRVCAMIWMFLGLAMFGITAGTISSELTASKLSLSVENAASLGGKNTGFISGTTSQQFVTKYNGLPVPFDTPRAAIDDLQNEGVVAFVYDYPVLKFMEQTEQWDNTYVLETIYDKQNYGIAFQKGKSQLRERINAALLTVQESGAFNDLQADYFGGAVEKIAEDDALGWWDGGPVWIVWSALIVVFIHALGLIWLTYKQESIKADIAGALGGSLAESYSGRKKDTELATAEATKDPTKWRKSLDDRIDRLQQAIEALAASKHKDSKVAKRSSKRAKKDDVDPDSDN